ncbi:hypothetical protein MMC25_006657 [Agyrium rufum]|nr:hypothetical protein [Agyrium rufum]
MSSFGKPPSSRRHSSRRRKSRQSAASIPTSTTEVSINVYDLLVPDTTLSGLLWTVGLPLLHTGVVVETQITSQADGSDADNQEGKDSREYAFGGHTTPSVTGVYYTAPRLAPPGGTWRCTVPIGKTSSFSLAQPQPQSRQVGNSAPQDETLQTDHERIQAIIRDVARRYLGTEYDLLRRNCNHFANELCALLTGRGIPSWVNRAAALGCRMPCLVPDMFVGMDEDEGEMLLDGSAERDTVVDNDNDDDDENDVDGGDGDAVAQRGEDQDATNDEEQGGMPTASLVGVDTPTEAMFVAHERGRFRDPLRGDNAFNNDDDDSRDYNDNSLDDAGMERQDLLRPPRDLSRSRLEQFGILLDQNGRMVPASESVATRVVRRG